MNTRARLIVIASITERSAHDVLEPSFISADLCAKVESLVKAEKKAANHVGYWHVVSYCGSRNGSCRLTTASPP